MIQREDFSVSQLGDEGDNNNGAEEEIARLQQEYERIQEQLKNLGDEDNDEEERGKTKANESITGLLQRGSKLVLFWPELAWGHGSSVSRACDSW